MVDTMVDGSIGELGGMVCPALVGSPAQPLPLLNSPMHPMLPLVNLVGSTEAPRVVMWLRT